jgi:hypothetical protein
MAAAAWLRRFVVSIGIGGASYAIMLGIMVLSIIYDREPRTRRHLRLRYRAQHHRAIDSLVSGSHWARWRRTTCGNG